MSVVTISGTYREDLRGTFLLSLLLHLSLFLAGLAYTHFGFQSGKGWGRSWGGGGATRVNVVNSLPGIPLPPAMQITRSTVANETRGLYQSEPEPKPLEKTAATEIQKFAKEAPPEKFKRINTRLQKERLLVPEHAVPYGAGGAPALSYGQFVNTAGEGGFGFGGDFGDRYAWYVNGVRARISNNWLLATISPNILSAPRLLVSFEILRDGSITNVGVTESSGMPEVDRSGLRAVLASNPLAPLPSDYPGSRVAVEFWFDFHRR